MRHAIDHARWNGEPGLRGRIEGVEEAVERCVHCGFCLAACPTYRVMAEEMDSPRGRIVLGKEFLEGNLALDDLLQHLDPCLGCLACETACPSGVRYRELLQPLRSYGERHRDRSLADRLRRALLVELMARPSAFRWALRLGRFAGRWPERWTPSALRAPLRLVPERLPPSVPRLPEVSRPPVGVPTRARVVLLTGCVQPVLDPGLALSTIEVLTHQGVEVLVPRSQGCCGSLALHVGDERRALRMARHNAEVIAEFSQESAIDAVLSTAAGCGSGIREMPDAAPSELRESLAEVAEKAHDVTAFLADLGLRQAPPVLKRTLRAAFQDPCHLLHAQGVATGPRKLLSQVAGLELVTPANAEMCCGSAGLYSLERPDVADGLGLEKARDLAATGAELVISGNIGCRTQIDFWMSHSGASRPVLHPMQVLAHAFRGTLIEASSG